MSDPLFYSLLEVVSSAASFILPFITISAVLVGARAMSKDGIKISLRVAVIGLPRAGKTTLISVIFDRLMSQRHARYITVNGVETVERITRYIGIVKAGISIPPTEDKDVFSFRYFVKKPLFWVIPRRYEVEISDFPGEYSDEITSGLVGDFNPSGMYKTHILQVSR